MYIVIDFSSRNYFFTPTTENLIFCEKSGTMKDSNNKKRRPKHDLPYRIVENINRDTTFRQKKVDNSYENVGPITYNYGGPITISIQGLLCVAFGIGRFTERACVKK